MADFALLFKISLPPILVALMTLAARRWGPTIGGMIMGLPWMTGPVLYFLGNDKGIDFLVAAARGVELAVWGMGAFILCFGIASAYVGWAASLLAAVLGYTTIGAFTQALSVPSWLATFVAVVVLFAAKYLLPLPQSPAVPGRLPPWDIPARMAATFLLVAVIMTTTDLLGPQVSGLVASYPVILTVIGVFTLRQWGRDALLRLLGGISTSLLTFVAFFAVVGAAAPYLGMPLSFAAAAVIAIALSGLLLVISRQPRSAMPSR